MIAQLLLDALSSDRGMTRRTFAHLVDEDLMLVADWLDGSAEPDASQQRKIARVFPFLAGKLPLVRGPLPLVHEVVRCSNCRQWRSDGTRFGECARVKEFNSPLAVAGKAYTEPHFACSEWWPKEGL